MIPSGEPRKQRSIYLLPNLLTTAGLFSGFYAIIASINHEFEAACIAVLIAMLWDGLDGRVARLTNTQSAFGSEYDSLSDMISFGIAPSLISYNWALSGLGKLGWLAAFLYTAGAGLRLARFNVQITSVDKRYFRGLASPAAAAVVIGMVWVGETLHLTEGRWNVVAGLLTLFSGLLMVSNFQYRSFKDIDWRQNVSFLVIFSIVLSFAIIALNPAFLLFFIALFYACSGPFSRIRSQKPITIDDVIGDTDNEPDEEDNDAEKPQKTDDDS